MATRKSVSKNTYKRGATYRQCKDSVIASVSSKGSKETVTFTLVLGGAEEIEMTRARLDHLMDILNAAVDFVDNG